MTCPSDCAVGFLQEGLLVVKLLALIWEALGKTGSLEVTLQGLFPRMVQSTLSLLEKSEVQIHTIGR